MFALPFDIGDMSRLEVLYCGGNKLTALPITLGNLSHLSVLYLGDNLLMELPDELCGLRRLRTLNVHNNRLRFFPTELMELPALENLSIRGNPLICDFVNYLPQKPMSLLELAGRKIKEGGIAYRGSVPPNLVHFLDSARTCSGQGCSGVYFDTKVKSVKVVDICGNYRVPLMEYLCAHQNDCRAVSKAPSAASRRRERLGAYKQHSHTCQRRMKRVVLSGIKDQPLYDAADESCSCDSC